MMRKLTNTATIHPLLSISSSNIWGGEQGAPFLIRLMLRILFYSSYYSTRSHYDWQFPLINKCKSRFPEGKYYIQVSVISAKLA